MLALACSAAFGHGAYHDVVLALEAILAERPGDVEVRLRLATAHVGHDEGRLALDELARIEALPHAGVDLRYLRGCALRLVGRREQARVQLDAFLAENPRHAEALHARSIVLGELREFQPAILDAQAVVEVLEEPEPDAFCHLADLFLANGQEEQAVEALDRGISRLGPVPFLLDRAYRLDRAAGRWDAALTRVDALRVSSPLPQLWMAEKARLLAEAGRIEAARAAWIELRDHLNRLPNLERGTPVNVDLLAEAAHALGEPPALPRGTPAVPPAAPGRS